MKTLTAAALGAFGLLLAAAPAEACGGPGEAVLHRTLPDPLPVDTFVAEIELDNELRSIWNPGLRGRVRRVIQGHYSGDTLIVRSRWSTSCDRPFGNGAVGFLIGVPDGFENGLLVVIPWSAPVSAAPPSADALRFPL